MSWVTSIVIMGTYLTDEEIAHIKAAPYRDGDLQWRHLSNCEDFGGNKCGETKTILLTSANNHIDRQALLDHMKSYHFHSGVVMYMDTEGWVEVYIQTDDGEGRGQQQTQIIRVTEPT